MKKEAVRQRIERTINGYDPSSNSDKGSFILNQQKEAIRALELKYKLLEHKLNNLIRNK